jgi:SAM-dependent methyltransferase
MKVDDANIVIYDHIAREFAERWDSSMTVRPFIDDFIELLPTRGGVVLDAGSGTGRDVAYMLDCGLFALGVDASSEMVNVANELHPGGNFLHMDLRKMDLWPDAMFSGVWCCGVLHHLHPRGAIQVLKTLARLLTPGGVIAVAVREEDCDRFAADRRFFYQQDENSLIVSLDMAGFSPHKRPTRSEAPGGARWLHVTAQKRK